MLNNLNENISLAQKKQLITEAREKYGKIFPCGTKDNLADCFTDAPGKVVFWFNTMDRSTRALSVDIKEVPHERETI